MNIKQKIELVKSWGFQPSVANMYKREIGATAMNPETITEIWSTSDSAYINIYVNNKYCEDYKIRWSDFQAGV